MELLSKASVFQMYDHDVFCSYSNRDEKALTSSIIKPLDPISRVFRNEDQIEGQEYTKQKSNEAIRRSKLALVFITKNYVNSTRCLDELVMIIKSKKIYGYQLCTILWDVDLPELVKHTFEWAKKELKSYSIEEWKNALREALGFAPRVLRKQADDDDLFEPRSINEITALIEEKLKTDGSKVLTGTTKGFLDLAANIEKIEEDGEEVGLQNQEGEGPSSKETQENPSLVLQCISKMTDIPLKVLEDNYATGVLDLSKRNIESLPKSISSLVELRKLSLRDDELLMELPSEIGALKYLDLLDVEGTELICLPKEIGELSRLETLKVTLYRCADSYVQRQKIKEIIPRGAFSKLSQLKELCINVDPDCKWWEAEAEAIIKELSELRNLKILKFYFSTDKLLKQFLKLENVYTSLSNFRLIVGHHEPDIVFSVPNKLQSEFEKSEKLLKYVNGKGNTDGIGKALERAKSLFLDRHWTIEKLSEFKICEMRLLVCCLVVECNEMKTIIDGSDFYGDSDNGKEPVLKLLRYLSAHHMKNLQSIWKGPSVKGCLSSLEILVLHTCPELITIFNLELLPSLTNLKELIVKHCPKIESLVTVEPDLLPSDHNFLPNLQNILLVHLPGLRNISSGLIIRPKLQKIVVYNCPNLENLSPTNVYSKYIHEIEDDSQWSKAMGSSSNETDYLNGIFVKLMDQLTPGTSLSQPSSESQAARTEGPVLNKDVLKEDKIEQGVAPYQYGMDRPSNNASIVLICGEAGIGKTTIAKSVYNLNYDKFEGSCFLSNIRHYSRKPNGLVRLQAQLLSSIQPKEKSSKDIYEVDDGILRIRNAVKDKRVLIVLDDVDNLPQLHALLGKRDWYCPGSKIIITTRQTNLLNGYEVHKVYGVKNLDEGESLRLFSLHAFGRDDPDKGYEDDSIKLVKHCGGIPLALVLLGSSLYDNRSPNEYQSVIKKMELIPQTGQLHGVLQVSFDALPDQKNKDLFLHIVCFFLGKDRDYVTAILEGCDFQAGTEIQTLANRCLLTIDLDNKLWMHRLLQDKGIEIARKEESLEKHRRVWQHEDAMDVLGERNIKGRETIEGLILDFPTVNDTSLIETNAFSRMDKLRLLQLNYVKLNGGYEEFPKDLVWLCWRGFPLSSLPTDFPMEKLVVLDVRYSNLKQVWEKTKSLPSLKILNLSHSPDLTCTPDFSRLPKLERLILKDCVNLPNIHKSIVELERLCLLNVKGCIKLMELPRGIFRLRSLEKLVLSGCSELLKQPEVLGELESSTEHDAQLHICK